MSFLDRVLDTYKFLDKNGLKKAFELIKKHDYHWTGTHAEYEAQKDSIPAYAILHFTDDYEDSVGIVDKIEINNMSAVTSNAVARLGTVYGKAITPTDRFPALSSTSSPNRRTIISIPVPAGIYLVVVCGRAGDVDCPDCNAAWPILNRNIQWCAGYVINSTETGNLKNMRYFNYNNTAVVTRETAGDITLEEYFEGSVPEHFYSLNMYAVLLRTLD